MVETIRTWVTAQRALPQSALGKALAYTTELWPGLVTFLEHPAIPVDNNATERALRGIALGRKNHYGSRSERPARWRCGLGERVPHPAAFAFELGSYRPESRVTRSRNAARHAA